MAHDLTCLRCSNQWTTKRDVLPKNCPKCTSSAWNKPKKESAQRPAPAPISEPARTNEHGGLPTGVGSLRGYPWNGEPARFPYLLDDERWKADLEDGHLRTMNCIPLDKEQGGFDFDFSIEEGDVGKTACVNCKAPHTEPFFFYRKAFEPQFPRTRLALLVTRCMSCGVFGDVFYHDREATAPHPRLILV